MSPADFKGTLRSRASVETVTLAKQMAKDWLTEVDADNRDHGLRPGWDASKCTPTPENIEREYRIFLDMAANTLRGQNAAEQRRRAQASVDSGVRS